MAFAVPLLLHAALALLAPPRAGPISMQLRAARHHETPQGLVGKVMPAMLRHMRDKVSLTATLPQVAPNSELHQYLGVYNKGFLANPRPLRGARSFRDSTYQPHGYYEKGGDPSKMIWWDGELWVVCNKNNMDRRLGVLCVVDPDANGPDVTPHELDCSVLYILEQKIGSLPPAYSNGRLAGQESQYSQPTGSQRTAYRTPTNPAAQPYNMNRAMPNTHDTSNNNGYPYSSQAQRSLYNSPPQQRQPSGASPQYSTYDAYSANRASLDARNNNQARTGYGVPGTSQYGTSQYGPSYGQQYGTAQYGSQYGTTQADNSRYGSPRYGSSRYGTSQYGSEYDNSQHGAQQYGSSTASRTAPSPPYGPSFSSGPRSINYNLNRAAPSPPYGASWAAASQAPNYANRAIPASAYGASSWSAPPQGNYNLNRAAPSSPAYGPSWGGAAYSTNRAVPSSAYGPTLPAQQQGQAYSSNTGPSPPYPSTWSTQSRATRSYVNRATPAPPPYGTSVWSSTQQSQGPIAAQQLQGAGSSRSVPNHVSLNPSNRLDTRRSSMTLRSPDLGLSARSLSRGAQHSDHARRAQLEERVSRARSSVDLALENRVEELLKQAFEEWSCGKIDTAELARRRTAAQTAVSEHRWSSTLDSVFNTYINACRARDAAWEVHCQSAAEEAEAEDEVHKALADLESTSF